MQQFQRYRQLAFGKRLTPRVEATAQRVGIEIQQRRWIGLQITDDQCIAIARMPGQRQDRRQIMTCRRETPGNVQHWLQQANLIHDPLLAAQLIEEVVQFCLPLAQQPCQANGGAYVGQRIVRLAVIDAVGLGQPLQLERYAPLLLRPFDAFGPQCVSSAYQIDQIPAAVAALPFARVRVEEVAIQTVTRHLIIEAQAVVSRTTGAGRR